MSVLPNLGLTGDIPGGTLNWDDEGRSNDRRLDSLVMPAVKAMQNTPPAMVAGERYIVGTVPTGAWVGHAGEIATPDSALAAWTYYSPKAGWNSYLESARSTMRFTDAWITDDLAVNVKRYGAKGDNATNDTAAVLAAITAVPAGSRLHFPAGTYLLSTWAVFTLSKVLWISGDGVGATILKSTGPAANVDGTNFLSITSGSFRCSDITLDSWGVVFNFSSVTTLIDNVLFENVEIKNYLRGVYGSNSVAITLASVDTGTEVLTSVATHGLAVGDQLIFANVGGALPGGITAGTTYYVKTVPSTTTFTLSATLNGPTLNLTSATSGTSTAYKSALGFRAFAVRGCRITTGLREAVFLNLPVMEKVHITDNVITDCVGKGIDLGGNALALADVRGEYVVENNIVNGVTNIVPISVAHPSGTVTGSAIAIICYGWRAVLAGNFVSNVRKLNPTASDTDGIYTKCRYTTIVGNVLVDASQAESAMNIKGGARNETVAQPYGFSVICANNILLDTQVAPVTPERAVTVDAGTDIFTATAHGYVLNDTVQFIVSGGTLPTGLALLTTYYVITVPTANTFTISTSLGGSQVLVSDVGSGTQTVVKLSGSRQSNGIKIATSDVLCVNNHVEGFTEIGIYTDSDTGSDAPCHNVRIESNTIVNHRGKAAIAIYGRGDRVRVVNNLIDGVLNSFAPTSQNIGIDINKKEGIGLDVIGNRIFNVANTGTTPVGISMNPGALSKILSAANATNTFTTTATHLGTPIAHAFSVNDVLYFTAGTSLPGGMFVATPYYVRTVPTGTTFTLSAAAGPGAELDITTDGSGVLTAFKFVTFSDWRILDNHINGARYGIQFTWDQTYIAVDGVFVRHNTGRNINSIVIPALDDLVKYTDAPTNLAHIPHSAPPGVTGMSRTGTLSTPMVELTKDTEAGAAQPQRFRLISGDDGAGNRSWFGFETSATSHRIYSGADGTGTVNDIYIRFNATDYWRIINTTGNIRPVTDAATDIGASGVRVRTFHGGGTTGSSLALAAFSGQPGDFSGGFIRLGGWRMWIEQATGKLRVKSSDPTIDSDGTIVGTQT